MEIPQQNDDFAAIIINQVVDLTGMTVGYVMIKDAKHPDPKWKLASGRKKPNETPQECAQRENKEETGLNRLLGDYYELEAGRWHFAYPNEHWSYVFVVKIPEANVGDIHSNDPGNEGEIPRYFTALELKIEEHYQNILSHHLKKIRLLEALLHTQAA